MRLSLLLLLLTTVTYAEYRNPVCEVYISKKEKNKYNYAYQDLKRLLNEKQYEVILFQDKPQYKLGAGRDYLKWDAHKTGRGFAPCKATLSLYRTRIAIKQSNDPRVWTNSSIRRLPRTSLSGKERCHYAIKDALAALPKCK